MAKHLLWLQDRSGAALLAGAICVAVAFSIQTLLSLYVGSTAPPFLAFFPAVVISTLIGGALTGWLALILSAILAWRFLFTSTSGFTVIDGPRLAVLALFLLSGSLIVLIASAYRRTLEKAEQDRQALETGEARLMLAHEAAKIGTWEYVLAEDRVIWSPQMFKLYERDPSLPAPTLAEWRSRVQLDGGPSDRYDLRRDLKLVGDMLDREVHILTYKGRSRWLIGRSVATGEPGHAPTRFTGVNIDITSQKISEERERLLAHELDHRAKNMLAMVQSVVQLTRAQTVPDFREAVVGRIQSLARSHSLLAVSRWEGADLARLMRDELAPFEGGEHNPITAKGPRITLQPVAAQTLALLIHELATNAVKYGALSTPEGKLAISWRLTSGKNNADLQLSWTETGGPEVSIPQQRGFGSRLIVTSIERQLDGNVALDWHRQGLKCNVILPAKHLIPLADEEEKEVETGIETVRSGGAPAFTVPPGKRVLLVEDEALIAMQMESALKEAGFDVVGPVSRLSDAPEAIANSDLDGAILDINLAGERSFAIADMLAARNVPFLFCTGFAATSILPDRFQQVPVITKPFNLPVLLSRLERVLTSGPATRVMTAQIGPTALQAE